MMEILKYANAFSFPNSSQMMNQARGEARRVEQQQALLAG
jgi:hypothetical protein